MLGLRHLHDVAPSPQDILAMPPGARENAKVGAFVEWMLAAAEEDESILAARRYS